MNFILLLKWLQRDEDFAKKIQTDLEGKCTKPISTIRKEFECNTNALDEASNKNGLTKQWEKFHQQLEKHLSTWKQCRYPLYVTNKFILIYWINIYLRLLLFSCNMKELSYVYSLFVQYLETIADEPNIKKFLEDLKLITKNC